MRGSEKGDVGRKLPLKSAVSSKSKQNLGSHPLSSKRDQPRLSHSVDSRGQPVVRHSSGSEKDRESSKPPFHEYPTLPSCYIRAEKCTERDASKLAHVEVLSLTGECDERSDSRSMTDELRSLVCS